MSAKEINHYLKTLEPEKAAGLQKLRATILEIIPDSEQCIAYGMPAFRVDGKAVAGFAAFKNHLSYFPHSGSVLSELGAELAKVESKGIVASAKGTLQFPVSATLPKGLVKKLIATRIAQLG